METQDLVVLCQAVHKQLNFPRKECGLWVSFRQRITSNFSVREKSPDEFSDRRGFALAEFFAEAEALYQN